MFNIKVNWDAVSKFVKSFKKKGFFLVINSMTSKIQKTFDTYYG